MKITPEMATALCNFFKMSNRTLGCFRLEGTYDDSHGREAIQVQDMQQDL